MQKGQSLQQIVMKKLDSHKSNNEVGPLIYHHIQKFTQNESKT